MINTSPSSSALLANLAVLPSSAHSAPAAAPSTPPTLDGARAPRDDGGFARAIKQALAQRANKTGSTPVRTTGGGAAAAGATAALPGTKKGGPKPAASDEADEGGKAPDSSSTGPGLTPRPSAVEPLHASSAASAAGGPSSTNDTTAQSNPSWPATADAAAASAATGMPNLASAPGTTSDSTRLQARPPLAGAAASALRNPAAMGTPAGAKSSDTDPGSATPLPRPQPADQAAGASKTNRPLMNAVDSGTSARPQAAPADAGNAGVSTAASSLKLPLPGDAAPGNSGARTTRSASSAAAAAAADTAPATAEPAQDGHGPADAAHTASGHAHGPERRNTAPARDAADRYSNKTALSAGARAATAAAPAEEGGSSNPAGRAGTEGVAGASPAATAAVPEANTPATAVAPSAAGVDAASTATASDANVVVNTPVTSPGFAAEAGYRLAVMVREGVTSAQLELNPADMGPVTVQIVVEGQTAQVHLVAAQADTRQALEASMPQLASNLRDAGLTLTGGGVFDQTSQQQGRAADAGTGNDRGGRQGRGDDGPVDMARTAADGLRAARSTSVQQRGVVDLIA